MGLEQYLKMERNFEDVKLKLSTSSKVSRSKDNTFSLIPGKTCPGKTKACEDCYASKNRRVFKSSRDLVYTNTVITSILINSENKTRFVDYIISNIKNKSHFRIHESGDFYSQNYINIWNTIIQNCKNTKFWAYTRSFEFDFSKIIENKNFKLYASCDSYNKKEVKKFLKKFNHSNELIKIAYGPIYEKDELEKLKNKGIKICPLNEKCTECNYCVDGRGDVAFKLH